MEIALWVVAGLLAAIMLVGGVVKAVQPREKLLSSGITWAEDYSDHAVRLIGIEELLGAIGLALPAMLDIAPILVPIAATCLALLMAGASVVHLRRGEQSAIRIPLALLVAAAFAGSGRFGS